MTFSESPTAFRGPFERAYTRLSASTRMTPIEGTPPPAEEEIPISQLPLAGRLFGDELVPIVQNGITCRALAGEFGDLTASLISGIQSELLAITTQDVIPTLTAQPDGQMTFLFLNGLAFSAVAGDFTVSGRTITWTNTIYSVNPGDEVVACYTYGSSSGGPAAVQEDVLTITSANVLPLLSQTPNGNSFTLYVEGRPFFLGVANPAFTLSGSLITWTSTVYSVQPGAEVVAQYTV